MKIENEKQVKYGVWLDFNITRIKNLSHLKTYYTK